MEEIFISGVGRMELDLRFFIGSTRIAVGSRVTGSTSTYMTQTKERESHCGERDCEKSRQGRAVQATT